MPLLRALKKLIAISVSTLYKYLHSRTSSCSFNFVCKSFNDYRTRSKVSNAIAIEVGWNFNKVEKNVLTKGNNAYLLAAKISLVFEEIKSIATSTG